jgi:hypothetical protein
MKNLWMIVVIVALVVVGLGWPWWLEHHVTKIRKGLLAVSERTILTSLVAPYEAAWLRRAIDRALLKAHDLLFWALAFRPSVRFGDAGPETNPHFAALFNDAVQHVETLFRVRYPITCWALTKIKGQEWVTGYMRRIVRHLGTCPLAEV